MSMEPGVILSIVKAFIPGVAKALVAQINSQLNPTDLEKALKAGITAAVNWDNTQAVNKQLFYHCEPKAAEQLLNRFFKDTGVQKELQKSLQDRGAPDLPFLIAAFKNTASQLQRLKFPENSIDSWLKKFADTYFENTSNYLKFKIVKNNYLEQLITRFHKVQFAGIAVPGQETDKSEKLENIFVMPDVVEQRQSEQSTTNVQQSLGGNVSQNQAKLSPEHNEQNQRTEEGQKADQEVAAGQLLSRNSSPKLVLLGEPGSGKTTLISYFAVKLAQNQTQELGLPAQAELLPIIIRIRDLAKHPQIDILTYLQQSVQNKLPNTEIPEGFFEYWLNQGKALILLDGLDEVADLTKRTAVVNHIDEFLKHEQFAQNQAIITSRPAGYRRDFFRNEEFSHYKILP